MLNKLLMTLGIALLVGCQESARYEQAVTPPPMQPPTVVTAQGARSIPSERSTYLPGQPLRKVEPRVDPERITSAGNPKSWVPAVHPRQWKYIVIHHSDTKTGSAAVFDRFHREVRHWNSLGYDFVIGNGTNSGDGQIEVGTRWRLQEDGAHAGVKYYNEEGIGICLVGDFALTHPTPAQLKSLARLTAYLMRTYHIPASHVIGHKDCGRQTNCPGKYMDLAQVRRMAAQYAGMEERSSLPMNVARSDQELLHEAR